MKRAVRASASAFPPARPRPEPATAPPRRLQRKPAEGPLGEYLRKRETAQSVPPAGALSVHGEIPDTLQAKSLPGALARAEALGHRAGVNFAAPPSGPVVQRSKFVGHTPGELKATPSAILAGAFGGEAKYRLKALSRSDEKGMSLLSTSDSKDEEREAPKLPSKKGDEETGSLWLFGSQLPKEPHVERAGSVKAVLEGPRRLSGGRKSSPIQTLIGSLGEMERAILGRGPSKSYEGGHLIGDQFLDQESYVAWNLAPQARGLNSPYYRQVEAMLALGAIHLETLKPDLDVPIDVEVKVDYTDDPYQVTVADLEKRNVIEPSAAKTHSPNDTLTFPRFVPSDWSLTATIDPSYRDEYVLPTTEVTPLMEKSTGSRSLVRIPSQEHIATPNPLNTVSEGKKTFGGGTTLSLAAQQHYPHPDNPSKGTKLDLGALLAPMRLQSRFSAPVNLLDKKDHDTILDDLGKLSSALQEKEGDTASWSAIAYYLTTAAAQGGAKDRTSLLEAAINVYLKPLRQISKAVSLKGGALEDIRSRLRQILFYDSYLTLSPKEKSVAEKYEDVEDLGATAYLEDEIVDEEESQEDEKGDVDLIPPTTNTTQKSGRNPKRHLEDEESSEEGVVEDPEIQEPPKIKKLKGETTIKVTSNDDD